MNAAKDCWVRRMVRPILGFWMGLSWRPIRRRVLVSGTRYKTMPAGFEVFKKRASALMDL